MWGYPMPPPWGYPPPNWGQAPQGPTMSPDSFYRGIQFAQKLEDRRKREEDKKAKDKKPFIPAKVPFWNAVCMAMILGPILGSTYLAIISHILNWIK